MTKEELKRKQYDTWNKYYQKHKSEINARRKKVREENKNKLLVAEKRIEELIALINAERERQEKCDDVHLRKIADLEKENAELKSELSKKADTNHSLVEQMAKLEEENAKLKEQGDKWHNVKDGNPDNENDILCQISKDEVEVGYYHTKQKRYYTIDGQPIDVIRWQKIVFPKESE